MERRDPLEEAETEEEEEAEMDPEVEVVLEVAAARPEPGTTMAPSSETGNTGGKTVAWISVVDFDGDWSRWHTYEPAGGNLESTTNTAASDDQNGGESSYRHHGGNRGHTSFVLHPAGLQNKEERRSRLCRNGEEATTGCVGGTTGGAAKMQQDLAKCRGDGGGQQSLAQAVGADPAPPPPTQEQWVQDIHGSWFQVSGPLPSSPSHGGSPSKLRKTIAILVGERSSTDNLGKSGRPASTWRGLERLVAIWTTRRWSTSLSGTVWSWTGTRLGTIW